MVVFFVTTHEQFVLHSTFESLNNLNIDNRHDLVYSSPLPWDDAVSANVCRKPEARHEQCGITSSLLVGFHSDARFRRDVHARSNDEGDADTSNPSSGKASSTARSLAANSKQFLNHRAAVQNAHLRTRLRVDAGQFADRRADHQRCDGRRHGIFGVFVAGSDDSSRMDASARPE
jgi:hypothetical protein